MAGKACDYDEMPDHPNAPKVASSHSGKSRKGKGKGKARKRVAK